MFQVGDVLLHPVRSKVAVGNQFFEVEHHAEITGLGGSRGCPVLAGADAADALEGGAERVRAAVADLRRHRAERGAGFA